jgi:hypothetical protein
LHGGLLKRRAPQVTLRFAGLTLLVPGDLLRRDDAVVLLGHS